LALDDEKLGVYKFDNRRFDRFSGDTPLDKFVIPHCDITVFLAGVVAVLSFESIAGRRPARRPGLPSLANERLLLHHSFGQSDGVRRRW
jgi:hypothetical protein